MFEVAEYTVSFRHIRHKPTPLPFIESVTTHGLTQCEIKDGNIAIGGGTTYCSVDDQFEYNEGRKRALERALEAAGFDKPTRTLFWEAYFKKRGKVG